MNYIMDNFRFDMTCRNEEPFKGAMKLAFGKSMAIAIVANPHLLIFTNSTANGAVELPFKMGGEFAGAFAWQWLQSAEYSKRPDHDGDNCRGWRIFNEPWGFVSGRRDAIIGVAPAWAMIGK